jgi:citrate lyase subunit beta/citryl-CoA lyase
MTPADSPPPRSLLYVPADNPRFLARAGERGADWLILDLEDGVAPGARDAARAGLGTWVPRLAAGGTPVAVRINADLARLEADALAAQAAGAVALVVPKASVPVLARLASVLHAVGPQPPGLIGIVEDAAALTDLPALSAAPGLIGLMLGSEDLALSLGAEPLPEVLHLPKLLTHYAARARGLWSFGLMRSIAELGDPASLAAAAVQARRLGFDGATCVHPSAVPILNAGFLPGPEELTWASRVIAAAEGRSGAFRLEGQMIDAPVVERAHRLLVRSGRAETVVPAGKVQ